MEQVVLGLPAAVIVACVPEVRSVVGVPSADGLGRVALHFVHEAREFAKVWKPDQSVDVIRHDDEADAEAVSPVEACSEVPDDDSLGVVLLKKLTPVVAGEGDEMDVSFVVRNSTFGPLVRHIGRLTDLGMVTHPS